MDKLIDTYMAIPIVQRFLVAVVLIVVVVVGYYYVVHAAQVEELQALEGKYSEQLAIKRDKENIAQYRTNYEAQIAKLQSQLDDVRAKLPDTADNAQLLAQLAGRARESGLKIDHFQPSGETPAEFYSTIGFTMTVQGTYHDIAGFIDGVGKLDRIINVSNLNLSQPKASELGVVLTAKFDIKTYRFTKGGGT